MKVTSQTIPINLTLGKVDVSLSLSQYKVDNKLIVVANVSISQISLPILP